MLGIDATFLSVVQTTCTAIVGMCGISAAMIGQFVTRAKWYERLILFAGGICLIDPGALTDFIGIGTLLAIGAVQYMRKKASAK